ncbi:MAG: CHASE2 domain-containing protein [Pseudomonadota bacterium]
MRKHHFLETGVFACVVAFLFASVLAFAVGRMPGQFATQLLTPNWMPQQIVKLIETSNDVQVAMVADVLPAEHPDIAIVLINEEALSELAYVSPIDRAWVSDLVKAIAALKPRVIALDLLFDRSTEPAKDALLIETLSTLDIPVVLGAADERYRMTEQARAWQAAFLAKTGSPVGYLNLQYDAQEASGDPIIRYRAAAQNGGLYPRSFADRIAEAAGHNFGSGGARSAGAKSDGIGGNRRIPWLGQPSEGETFFALDAVAVLEAARDPDGFLAVALGPQIAGRIVIVGGDFPGRDRHPTPITMHGDDDMLGVQVHAQILAARLDGRFLTDLGPRTVQAVVFGLSFFGLVAGILLHRRGKMLAWGASIATLGVVVAGLAALWVTREVVPLALFVSVLLGSVVVARLLVRFAPSLRL